MAVGYAILHALTQELRLTEILPFSTCAFQRVYLPSKEEKSILDSSSQENAPPQSLTTGSETDRWSQLLCSATQHCHLCPSHTSRSQGLSVAKILRQACSWETSSLPMCLAWSLPICLEATFLELHYSLRLFLHNSVCFLLSFIGVRPTSRSEHSTDVFWLPIILTDDFPQKMTCICKSV